MQGISAAGLEGLGQAGQQPQGMQQMMQQMMGNPMMQNMLSNPEMLRNILQSNPQIRQVRIESHYWFFSFSTSRVFNILMVETARFTESISLIFRLSNSRILMYL